MKILSFCLLICLMALSVQAQNKQPVETGMAEVNGTKIHNNSAMKLIGIEIFSPSSPRPLTADRMKSKRYPEIHKSDTDQDRETLKQQKAIEEKNKAIVRKYAEDEDNGESDFIYELVDPAFVYHYPNGQDFRGLDRLKRVMTEYQKGFPDGKHEIECQLAEGDLVATRFNMTGTHTAEYMGIPPTNKQFKLTMIDICRIKDGKIVEAWVEFDPSVISRLLNEERNKDLVKQLLSEMDMGNPSIADEVISAECIWHMPGGIDVFGAVAFKESDAQFRTGFADLQHYIEDLIAIGDKVVVRLKNTATHTGSFAGVGQTGKKINVTVNAIYRFKQGKIIEGWVEYDALGLMQQIGAIQWVSQAGNL
jgi:predicted ester cyclase